MQPIDLVAVRAFAAERHAGQLYGDEPYINHLDRVASRVPTDVEKAVALLHDVVEEKRATFGEIFVRFGVTVADGIDAVTRRPGEVYMHFIMRASNHQLAHRVKQSDLADHLSRSSSLKPSLKKRYEAAMKWFPEEI